jgi:hypothetical protein
VAHESILSRNPEVVFRAIAGGGVLLNTKTGAYHEVNATAREIWDALETPSTESEVLKHMSEVFGNVPELEADLREFIGDLSERNLVVVTVDDNTHEE